MQAPKLLAWCSEMTNEIKIVDLVTKDCYAEFVGAQLKSGLGSGFRLIFF